MRAWLGTLRRRLEGSLVFLGLLLVIAAGHADPDCCSTSDGSFSSVSILMIVGRLDFAPDYLLRGYDNRVTDTINTRRWSHDPLGNIDKNS